VTVSPDIIRLRIPIDIDIFTVKVRQDIMRVNISPDIIMLRI